MADEADYGRPQIWDEIGALLREHRVTVGSVLGWVNCEPGWSWQRTLQEYDIWSVVDGSGAARVNGTEVDLHAGTTLLLRPGDRIAATQHPVHRLTVGFVHYFLPGATPDLLPPRVVRLREPKTVHDRLHELVDRMERPDSTSGLHAEGLLRTALLEVHTQAAQEAGCLPAPIDPRIRNAIEELRSRPAQRPSLAEAARAAGLSAAHFSRLFRQETGISFRAYCVRVRMDRARTLLADTSFPVTQVAQLLGYTDYRLFARQFADNHGGRSPSHWRRGGTPAARSG